MIVKELIEALKVLDPNLRVITAKDDEGNGYHSADLPEEAYSPELDAYWIDTVIPKSCFEDYDEYDLEEKPEANCVVL